jgi:hypothetical protein
VLFPLLSQVDKNEQKLDINFDANNFAIKDSAGAAQNYSYTQNSVSIENSVATYGIQLKDGRSYQINFPNSSNENVGLIKVGNGNFLYTISRTEYLKYEDIYTLK